MGIPRYTDRVRSVMGAGRPDPGFLIVGVTNVVWKEYCSWFEKRGVPEPPYVTDSVFVAGASHLLAGCCIYPCDGPFAVVEHAATNPDVPARLAHGAMAFGAKALTAYGAMRKKTMLCFPVNKGMASLLRKAGFEMSAAPVMTHGPWSER